MELPGDTTRISMKKLFYVALTCLSTVVSCNEFDDSTIWDKLDEHESRIARLEELCKQMNTNITSLQSILNALQNNDYVTAVVPVTTNGDIIGYTISFTKSQPITIYHGKDGKNGTNGADGVNGSVPVIGAKQDMDGIYYWTLNGDWLLDEYGNKIKAQGIDGKDGQNGEDGKNGSNGKDGTDGKDGEAGVTPKLKIQDGFWYISYDNGSKWTKLDKATGADGKDGDAFFSDIWTDEANAYFQLVDGTIITVPLASVAKFNIMIENENIRILSPGEIQRIGYTISAATETTIVKAISQNGWTAVVIPKDNAAGEIIIQAPDPIENAEILVFASDGEGHTVMAVIDCRLGNVTVAKNNYEVDASGGDIKLIITTNMPYHIDIPDNAQSWISEKIETKSDVTEVKTLIVAENTEYHKRYAAIELSDSDGNVLETVVILQEAASFSGDLAVTVENVGELSNALASYDYQSIKNLSISGPLNETDYNYLKNELVSLKKLNLADATGVEPIFAGHKYTLDLVILPSSQTSISDSAFEGSYIVEVVLPENLVSIGNKAFYNCERLTKDVYIPKSVNYIGTYAFDGTKVENILFENGISLVKFSENSLPPTLKYLEVPASILVLETKALENLTALEQLSFAEGSNITEIPSLCFAGLPLKSVSLPVSLKKIGGAPEPTNQKTKIRKSSVYGGAFEGCTDLSSISIPSSVEDIEPGAFHGSGLQTVTFGENCKLKVLSGWSWYADNYNDDGGIRVGSFSKTSLKTLEIPENIIEIADAAFADCVQIHSVDFTMASSLEKIAGILRYDVKRSVSGAFYNCSQLQRVTIPSSVKEISAGAFANCTGLISLKFSPNAKLEVIGGSYCGTDFSSYYAIGAFTGCTALKEVTIPASVKTIGVAAFKGCTSLAYIHFEENSQCETIKGIGFHGTYITAYGAFDGTAIKVLTLPKSITSVDGFAFANMTLLSKVVLDNNANIHFPTYSFYNSRTLTEIDATNASFSAAHGTFAYYKEAYSTTLYYCPIQQVRLGSVRPPACVGSAFGDLSSATLCVPADAVEEYKQADGWKKFGTITNL